jgi:thiamine biosynthesis protein ThiI
MHCAIVHYHELALKGRNRDYFERQLIENIRTALKGVERTRIESLRGRVRIVLPESFDEHAVKERLSAVFGIANFSFARAVPLDLLNPNLDALAQAIGAAVGVRTFDTFRVTAKRADKCLPLTSMDVEKIIGQHVRDVTGKTVKLSSPDLTIYIELLAKDAYYSLDKFQGPGGMPVGVSGTVTCLLSGGIDSPVAAYRMMKRGCNAVFVHFSGRPLVSRASEDKARELVQILTAHQYRSRLFIVPFGEIQREIVAQAPAPYRVVLYRRLMVRIAGELAMADRCWALVTGDSLGQVASQTPENLAVVEEAAELPLLRPLIGMDKLEITDQAQRIGTFSTSIEPDQDCCSLFVPPHPSTKTRIDDIRRIERSLDVGTLVKQGLDKAEVCDFTFP